MIMGRRARPAGPHATPTREPSCRRYPPASDGRDRRTYWDRRPGTAARWASRWAPCRTPPRPRRPRDVSWTPRVLQRGPSVAVPHRRGEDLRDGDRRVEITGGRASLLGAAGPAVVVRAGRAHGSRGRESCAWTRTTPPRRSSPGGTRRRAVYSRRRTTTARLRCSATPTRVGLDARTGKDRAGTATGLASPSGRGRHLCGGTSDGDKARGWTFAPAG